MTPRVAPILSLVTARQRLSGEALRERLGYSLESVDGSVQAVFGAGEAAREYWLSPDEADAFIDDMREVSRTARAQERRG